MLSHIGKVGFGCESSARAAVLFFKLDISSIRSDWRKQLLLMIRTTHICDEIEVLACCLVSSIIIATVVQNLNSGLNSRTI